VTSEPSRTAARVVLATRASADAARLLAEAGTLARALRAELAGVFVEESDLLRLAALPMCREVGFSSGTVRAIDLASTLRQFERQAAEVRRLVAQTAAGFEVPWSFTVERGTVLEVAVAAAEGPDVALLAPPRGALGRTVGAAGHRTGTTVGVFYDGGPAGDRALAAALELVQHHPEVLTLVVPDAADPLPLRRRAAGLLGVAGRLPDAVASRELRRRPARALVVSVGSLVGNGGADPRRPDLRRLLASAPCPLVLVR